MANAITCESCSDILPKNEASICNPKFLQGNVRRMFFTLPGANADFGPAGTVTTGVDLPTAWSARMDQTAEAAGAIVTAHITGAKARAEQTKQTFSLNREVVTSTTHTVTFTMDELNPVAHDFMRTISECGGQLGIWYETGNDKRNLWGSTEGVHKPIIVSIAAGLVVPQEVDGVIVWQGEAVWKTNGTENYISSPVPDTPEPAGEEDEEEGG